MSLFAHELEELVLDLQTQVQALDARVAALEAAATDPPANDATTEDANTSVDYGG